MKKNIFFIALLYMIIPIASAQFNLENVYNNTGYFKHSIINNGLTYGINPLYLVHLEIDGDKYVEIDKMGQMIKLYNIDYSLWKTIDYSSVTTNITSNVNLDKFNSSILYISQNLFNTDNKVEFIYTCYWINYSDTTANAITQIVNEDGTILFSRNAAPMVQPTFHNQYYPIYNTSNGTKMILSNINGTAEVFSLGGTFTAGIATNNILSNAAEMSLFPNPTMGANMITVNYQLPQGTQTADLIIHDTQGKQIKSYKISSAMNSILLDASELSSGMYYYSIQTADGKVLETKKMVKQ